MNNADVPAFAPRLPSGRYWPWNWSTEIRPEDRAAAYTAAGNTNFVPDIELSGYRNTLDRDFRTNAVIYPDMVGGRGQSLWGGEAAGQPLTPAALLQRLYAQSQDLLKTPAESRLHPDAVVDQVVRTLAGEQIPDSPYFSPRLAASQLLDILRSGAVYGGADPLQLAQSADERQGAEDRIAMDAAAYGRRGLDPETAVAPHNARYLAAQQLYDYARAMQDGEHRPPYADLISTGLAGISSPFSSANWNTFKQMANPFQNPLVARANVADYWRMRAALQNDPQGDTFALRTAPTVPHGYAGSDLVNAIPGMGGLEAIYPDGSSTNISGFGQNTGGYRVGETPYGRASAAVYDIAANPTRSVLMPAFLAARDNPYTGYAKGPMESLGVLGPAQQEAAMRRSMDRTMPQIPEGMSREEFNDLYSTRRKVQAADENWGGAYYPTWQAHAGVSADRRTNEPNWFYLLRNAPQNVVGDLPTAATMGAGGILGGLTRGAAASALGKSPAVVAGASLRGAARGAAGGLTTMVDATDPMAEAGLAYGATAPRGQGLMQWLTDRQGPEWTNPAAPSTSPQSDPADIRRDIDSTWQQTRDTAGNMYREWQAATEGTRVPDLLRSRIARPGPGRPSPPVSPYELEYERWRSQQPR